MAFKTMLGLAAGLLIGCATPEIKTMQDKQASLDHYQTYKWLSQDDVKTLRLENPNFVYMAGSSSVVRRPDIEADVKRIVDPELQKHGFSETHSKSPSFFITYYAKAKDEDWMSTWNGEAPSVDNVPVIMYPNFDIKDVRNYRDGNILIVLYDSKTKRPSWTGIIVNLGEKSIDLAKIKESISKLVANLVSNIH